MKLSPFYISRYLIASLFSVSSCAQDSARSPKATVQEYRLALGASEVKLRKTTYSTDYSFYFVQLHSNEATADQVTQMIADESGIEYLQIRNDTERIITFRSGNKQYRFDPNRIFSNKGIVETLKLHSTYTENAFLAVRRFRDSLLNHLDQTKTIIAVHNNTEADFSLTHYLESRTGQVYKNSEQDEDDFFITTDSVLFNQLKEKNFNVVLEDGAKITDDGSLSVYCSQKGIPYINVEAEHGHLEEQERMLRALLQVLHGKKP
ncbi:MAG: hypothetical protein EON98_09975 [Chitinophagaceae bacterium]|nr:MAG: hypothetical protein EON98_09975 [Chitinophagaceae bacterium]